MITSIILNFIFNSAILLISLVLYPINALVTSLLPSLTTTFAAIDTLLETVADGIAYGVSYSLLPPLALQIIVLYYTFILTFPLAIYFIKVAIKWFNKLK